MIRDLLSQVVPVVVSAAALTAPVWLVVLVRWARHPHHHGPRG